MECLNCQKPVSEKFCPHCGQKTSTKRLSMGVMVGDFVTALLNTEKGILRTLIDLFCNPGQMIRRYMSGHRTTYISVGKFTLLMVVMFTLSLSLLENHFSMFEQLTKLANIKVISTPDEGDATSVTFPLVKAKGTIKKGADDKGGKAVFPNKEKTIQLDLPAWGRAKKYSKKVSLGELQAYAVKLIPTYHRLFFDYLRVLSVLWIPIFALFTYMFFFRSRMNLAEHLTLNAYLFSQSLFIFIALSPLFWIFPAHSSSTFTLCGLSGISFLFFSLCDFFKKERVPLVKATGVVALGLTTYVVILSISAFGLALLIGYENIDQL